MRRRIVMWGLLVALGMMGGCSTPPEETAGDPGGEPVGEPAGGAGIEALAGDWELVLLDGSRITPDLPSSPGISFTAGGDVSGSTGMNRYTTRVEPLEVGSGAISFGETATTRMAGPQSAMIFENLFLEKLSAVSRWAIEGKRLVLYAGPRPILTFTRSSTGTH